MKGRRRQAISVNDRVQSGYRYERVAPMGRNFQPEFRPELTPKQMFALGVFCGKYMTYARKEFPASWFTQAKLSPHSLFPQLFWHGCQSTTVSVAQEGFYSFRRSARMVPMVLPLLHGPTNARRGCATDQALERYAPPRGPNQTPLRTR